MLYTSSLINIPHHDLEGLEQRVQFLDSTECMQRASPWHPASGLQLTTLFSNPGSNWHHYGHHRHACGQPSSQSRHSESCFCSPPSPYHPLASGERCIRDRVNHGTHWPKEAYSSWASWLMTGLGILRSQLPRARSRVGCWWDGAASGWTHPIDPEDCLPQKVWRCCMGEEGWSGDLLQSGHPKV